MRMKNNLQGIGITVLGLILNLLGSALRDFKNEFNPVYLITYIGIALIATGAYLTYLQSKTYVKEFKKADYNESTGDIVKVKYSEHRKRKPVAIIYKEVMAGKNKAYSIPTKTEISIIVEGNGDIRFNHPESFDGVIFIK